MLWLYSFELTQAYLRHPEPTYTNGHDFRTRLPLSLVLRSNLLNLDYPCLDKPQGSCATTSAFPSICPSHPKTCLCSKVYVLSETAHGFSGVMEDTIQCLPFQEYFLKCNLYSWSAGWTRTTNIPVWELYQLSYCAQFTNIKYLGKSLPLVLVLMQEYVHD